MKRVLVTGGSGFLGGRIVEVLSSRGIEVVGLARAPAAGATVEARGGRAAMGDLSDPSTLDAALQGVDTVIHSAAYLHFWGAWSAFVAANVDASRALVTASRRAGVTRFVHVSAASVVMRELGAMLDVDETAPLTNLRHMPYSMSKAMAEVAVLAGTSEEMPIVAVRPPLIWGPGDTFDGELGTRIAKGQFAYFDGGRYPYTVCHVDNAVQGVLLACDHGRGGESYFIADAEKTEAREFLDARIRAAGLTPPRTAVPTRVAWMMSHSLEVLWRTLRLKGDPPLTREVVRLMGARFTLNLKKAQTHLGYVPIMSRTDGLAALASATTGTEASAPLAKGLA